MNNVINIIQLMQNMIFAAFSYQGMKNPLPHGIIFMRLLSAKKEKATCLCLFGKHRLSCSKPLK